MIARCVRNTGASLGEPVRGDCYKKESVFHVAVGAEYPVLALGMFETVLSALVCDETGKPNWLPLGLFEFEPQLLPAEWRFAVFDSPAASGGDASNRWVAKWGYSELVDDPTHSDRLIERDPEALEVFFTELAKVSTNNQTS